MNVSHAATIARKEFRITVEWCMEYAILGEDHPNYLIACQLRQEAYNRAKGMGAL